jgi:hypothetical protein
MMCILVAVCSMVLSYGMVSIALSFAYQAPA